MALLRVHPPGAMTTRTKGKDMKKAKLSLAWQIVIGLVLGVAIGALLNHFSAEKAAGYIIGRFRGELYKWKSGLTYTR